MRPSLQWNAVNSSEWWLGALEEIKSGSLKEKYPYTNVDFPLYETKEKIHNIWPATCVAVVYDVDSKDEIIS